MAGVALALACSAECLCGTIENFPRGLGLPAGWRETPDGVQCPDCAHSVEPLLIPSPPAKAVAGQHGCRLQHSILTDKAVVLRISAGAKPVGDPLAATAVFVATAADLDELIDRLARIRASLPKPKGNRRNG